MLVLIDAFVCVWACDPHIAGRRCLSPSIARLLIICVDTCSHCHCVCRNSLDDIHSILLFPEIHKQIKPAFCFWLRSFLFSSVQKPTEHFTFRKYSEKWLLNTNLSTMCFRSLCFFFSFHLARDLFMYRQTPWDWICTLFTRDISTACYTRTRHPLRVFILHQHNESSKKKKTSVNICRQSIQNDRRHQIMSVCVWADVIPSFCLSLSLCPLHISISWIVDIAIKTKSKNWHGYCVAHCCVTTIINLCTRNSLSQ